MRSQLYLPAYIFFPDYESLRIGGLVFAVILHVHGSISICLGRIVITSTKMEDYPTAHFRLM
uniref:FXYD domain-containing ion transport regulator n=1 Tax=Periophthalmus magnuspinnatus TaxID=409849 RepID=A0A3B3ZM20_9GOBI